MAYVESSYYRSLILFSSFRHGRDGGGRAPVGTATTDPDLGRGRPIPGDLVEREG